MGIRDEVLETIIDVMREAEDRGEDAVRAARAAFPGTPDMVLYEAAADLDIRKTEAWWEQVERTIDGEIIRKAIGVQNEGGAQ